MNRQRTMIRLGALAMLLAACASGPRAEPERLEAELLVYKTPSCVCCGAWVTAMQEEGFSARVIDLPDLSATKAEHGVPFRLSSCHTTLVGGYVIEGHVPAVAIRRLLDERPNARGIVVPGMPPGSVGMPGPPTPYDVLLLHQDGTTSTYMRMGGGEIPL
jgi:hypothetical protein